MTRRRVAIGAAIVLGLVGLAWAGGWFWTGVSVPRDTTVARVDVGGLEAADARAKLAASVEERKDQAVKVTHPDLEDEFVPAELGIEVDVAASIAAAGGERTWSPRAIWRMVAGGDDLPPVLIVNRTALQAGIGVFANEVDVPVVEPEITFPKAKPKAKAPRPGRLINREELGQRIQDAYLMSQAPVKAPVDVVQPTVDAAGLSDAMTQIAEPAVSGPVELRVEGRSVDLPVTAWAPALRVIPVNGAMAPVLDPKVLAKTLRSATTGIGDKPVDARFKFTGGKVKIVPGKPGIGLDPERMSKTLVTVLTKTGPERSLAISTSAVDPAFTTEDAEALGIKERIGSFTTRYPHADYRNINQAEAARRINGTILRPGETFSFNKTVGERTRANGFVSGFVINGGVFREELGGGVSQVATTVYNAAFFAGLDDVEHHPHAFYINRYPVGREATVYWGNLDLRFKNSYKTGVVLRAWVNPSSYGRQGEMHVEVWGTKVYDIVASESPRRNFRQPGERWDPTDRCVAQDPITGFDIDIHRHFKKGGKTVRTETRTAHYQAADRVNCGTKPKPKTETPPAE